jgi:transposase-like protein
MPAAITLPAPAGLLWLEDAAKRLGVQPTTLRKWRMRRVGPASFKHAGRVVYRESSLVDYLNDCEAADSRSNPALNPLLKLPEPRLGSRRTAAA